MRRSMRDFAIVLALCATSCVARPTAVINTDVPAATCATGIACTEGGGRGTLLVPAVAVVALAVIFTVALFAEHPDAAQD